MGHTWYRSCAMPWSLVCWLIRAPHSVMSVDEFEDAAQIINKVGVATCFEGKLSDAEMRSWPFGNYLRHHFAEEWKTRKLVFRDEAQAMFNRLAAQAADAAA